MNLDEPVRDLYRRRLHQHMHDTYMGRRIQKFPEDLWVYEQLLHEMRADTVIELGVASGGSTLWFRDRLWTLNFYELIDNPPTVIAVDVQPNPGLPATIQYLQADICDPNLPDRIAELLPDRARPFIVEDAAHNYDTTIAALYGFAQFVPDNGFFVVEDGVVDVEELRIDAAWPRGVKRAVGDWLHTDEGLSFVVRYDLERYGITCHPGGFLQRCY